MLLTAKGCRNSLRMQIYEGNSHASGIQQFHGYTATKLIVAEVQPFQVGEVAQFRRYRPAQLVVAEAQISNAPVGVSANALPLSQRLVTQPVSVVLPTASIGGVVQSRQSGPVGIHVAGSWRG